MRLCLHAPAAGIEKGRTTDGAPLVDNADVLRTDDQLLKTDVVDKDGPYATVLRGRTVANANRH